MMVRNLRETFQDMTSQKVMKIVKEFIQGIKQSSSEDLKGSEVDFYDFAEGVGRIYLATTNSEFESFVRILREAICQKDNSTIKLEIKPKATEDGNFNIADADLDSLLEKMKKFKNGQLKNLKSRKEEVIEVEDEETVKYKIRSIFSEASMVRYNKFLVVKEIGYKKYGDITEEFLDYTDSTPIMLYIFNKFDTTEEDRVKKLIKMIGKVYEATNDKEFKMFVEMLDNSIIINQLKKLEFTYNEEKKEEEFWRALDPLILGSLFAKIRGIIQGQDLVRTKELQKQVEKQVENRRIL